MQTIQKDDWCADIRREMFQKNYRQNQLAKDIGIAKTYLCEVLNGKRGGPTTRQKIENAVHAYAET